MASKKTAITALSGSRLMMKELMHYKFEMGTPAGVWDLSKNGYENRDQINTVAGARYLVGRTYFDLSGYTREHLTTFPSSLTVQESGSFRMKEDVGSPLFGSVILDIVTEEHLTDDQLDDLVEDTADKEVCPSFTEGPLEFSQVIYGRYRMFGHDTSIWTPAQGNLTLLNEQQWGSGSPTTVDKLLIYRIIIPLGEFIADPDDYVIVPAARYILSAVIAEEDDSSYMMRQKRSFELAT